MLRRPATTAVVLLSLVLALALSGVAAQGANLLQNPGAEAGAGGADSSGAMPPPGWQVTGDETVVQYGASGGFPDQTVSAAIQGGKNFFAGGNAPSSTATQTVDVSSAAGAIDANTETVSLSADLGGYSSQTDRATVAATYLSAAGASLGSLTLGPVTAADRNDQTTLLPRTAAGTVPSGTRSISVVITSTRDDGSYNDGYADNVLLSLGTGGGSGGGGTGTPPPAPVLYTAENVKPVSGTVYIKLPPGATLARAASAGGPVAWPSLAKGVGFVPLTQARQIPVGSILDTRTGTVAVTAASPTRGQTFAAQFTAGIFQLLQQRGQKGLTTLSLMDSLSRATVCASSGKKASAARKVSSKVLGLLKSTDHGRFSTRGSYSSATVRGTAYSVADTCAGTLTKVTRGSVSVDYFRRHKTVVVKAGQSFLAQASGAPSAVIGK